MLILLLIAGCADPISNDVFYDEAKYLAALPTADRFHAPADFLDLVSTDEALSSATGRASDLRALYAPMNVCGEALFDTEPDVRGDTFRTWDAVPVVIVTGENTWEWWVRGTVTSLEDGAWTWTMEGAISRAGPWHELASGRHEASDAGLVTWRLDQLGQLVDVSIPGCTTEPTNGCYVRHVYARQPDNQYGLDTRFFTDPLAADPVQYWAAQGDSLFSWSDLFRLTTDGQSWPGVAVAIQTSTGGRADGFLWTSETTQIAFGDCWNASGATTWTGGDVEIEASGSESACVTGPLVEP